MEVRSYLKFTVTLSPVTGAGRDNVNRLVEASELILPLSAVTAWSEYPCNVRADSPLANSTVTVKVFPETTIREILFLPVAAIFPASPKNAMPSLVVVAII